MNDLSERIANRVVSIPDYPQKGVIFRDIMPIAADAELFNDIIAELADHHKGESIDRVVAIESRGFVFGGALAHILKCGFTPIRKAGKLPRETIRETYQLEYGEGAIELQKDSLAPGAKVILVDDLLATGGTVEATVKMIKELGGEPVGCAFIIELSDLHGRDALSGMEVLSLLTYEGE